MTEPRREERDVDARRERRENKLDRYERLLEEASRGFVANAALEVVGIYNRSKEGELEHIEYKFLVHPTVKSKGRELFMEAAGKLANDQRTELMSFLNMRAGWSIPTSHILMLQAKNTRSA